MANVIYHLDEDGEANGQIEFFCSSECRQQSPYFNADATAIGDQSKVDIEPETVCETCNKLVAP